MKHGGCIANQKGLSIWTINEIAVVHVSKKKKQSMLGNHLWLNV